jgi:DNA-binding transcriptional ArsR family regulator
VTGRFSTFVPPAALATLAGPGIAAATAKIIDRMRVRIIGEVLGTSNVSVAYIMPMMQTVIQAISEPRRREILRMVRDRELAAGEIAAGFDVTRPAISQHLTVLKKAGLVSERREGTRRLYRARPEGLAELRSFLDGFWEESLERLKVAAEREQRKGRVARAAKRN